jgi:argininosuccinate synthase
MAKRFKKIVCAYSGGLDTSVMIPWLKENYGAEIVTYTGDLGQGEDLTGIRQKALNTGAVAAEVEDLRDRFVSEFIWPAVRASAVYEGQYPLHTALGRPLLSLGLVETAHKHGADAIAHGALERATIRFALS